MIPETDNVTVLVEYIEGQFDILDKMDKRNKKGANEVREVINEAVDKVNTLAVHKIYKKC